MDCPVRAGRAVAGRHRGIRRAALGLEAETEAQRIAAYLLAARAEQTETTAAPPTAEPDWQQVDLRTLESGRPRSVGVEQVALWVMDRLRLDELLADTGLNGLQRSIAKGLVIARMAHTGNVVAAHRWLTRRTGLGELIGQDFEVFDLARIERTAQRLLAGERSLQRGLFERISGVSGLEPVRPVVELREAPGHERSAVPDPSILLATVFAGSGFIRHARAFRIRRLEPAVLRGMLERLDGSETAGLVLKPSLAAPSLLAWLRETGRAYCVVADGLQAVECLEWNPEAESDPGWLVPRVADLIERNALLQTLGAGSAGRPASTGAGAFRWIRVERLLTVLAFQLVQVIHQALSRCGITDTWDVLRDDLGNQQRLTTRVVRADGSSVHIRHATPPEPAQQRIVAALAVDPFPGGRQATVQATPGRRS